MLTSHVICFVRLHQYFPKYVYSAKYDFFCSSLVLWFLVMFRGYFMNDFEIVLIAPIVTDITPVFAYLMLCISSTSRSYFGSFLASF